MFREAFPDLLQIIKPRFLQAIKTEREREECEVGLENIIVKQKKSVKVGHELMHVYLPCQLPECEKNPEAPRGMKIRREARSFTWCER